MMRRAAAREVGRVDELVAGDPREVLQRIARGDQDALGELYSRFRVPLFRYLCQLTGDEALAEDILQETLVAVWTSAGGFAGQSSVLTWLIGVARRQAHNILRRRSVPLADADALRDLPAEEPEPEDAVLARAEREELARAVRRLPTIYREALVLAFVHGLSYREMAEVLEVPEGTVKSRLSNAKRALRALLDSHEEGIR
ncbi:MAG TPA: sigma-70 family RNA polymerase sigma factor [Chloroflexota bacterium]|nr:sigma-70 family RNA polymerase sigma factor [Chloroflexota bacterium]